MKARTGGTSRRFSRVKSHRSDCAPSIGPKQRTSEGSESARKQGRTAMPSPDLTAEIRLVTELEVATTSASGATRRSQVQPGRTAMGPSAPTTAC